MRVALLLLALLSALLPGQRPHRAEGRLKVVATFSILGDLVREVGGEAVDVTTLVGPDSDAHTYQPKPTDARALAGAKVLVSNGLGFEGWIDRLAEAASFKGKRVVASAGAPADSRSALLAGRRLRPPLRRQHRRRAGRRPTRRTPRSTPRAPRV